MPDTVGDLQTPGCKMSITRRTERVRSVPVYTAPAFTHEFISRRGNGCSTEMRVGTVLVAGKFRRNGTYFVLGRLNFQVPSLRNRCRPHIGCQVLRVLSREYCTAMDARWGRWFIVELLRVLDGLKVNGRWGWCHCLFRRLSLDMSLYGLARWTGSSHLSEGDGGRLLCYTFPRWTSHSGWCWLGRHVLVSGPLVILIQCSEALHGVLLVDELPRRRVVHGVGGVWVNGP
jgi:hypothetical protein